MAASGIELGRLESRVVEFFRERRSRLARWSWRLALLAVPVLVLSALAHRFGLIDTPRMYVAITVGFGLAFAAVIAAAVALYGIWRDGHSGFAFALAGVVLGLFVLVVPAIAAWRIVTLPRLADISTDTLDPPVFAFGGQEGVRHPARPLASDLALQREAYPDLLSHRYPVGVARALEEVRALAERYGWHILDEATPVSVDGSARLEAVAMTLLLAARDDVVIRIEPDGDGARVDMRSASRYVKHDLGSNASRVRTFMAALDRALAGAVGEVVEEQ
jgi:hypothetical protein